MTDHLFRWFIHQTGQLLLGMIWRSVTRDSSPLMCLVALESRSKSFEIAVIKQQDEMREQSTLFVDELDGYWSSLGCWSFVVKRTGLGFLAFICYTGAAFKFKMAVLTAVWSRNKISINSITDVASWLNSSPSEMFCFTRFVTNQGRIPLRIRKGLILRSHWTRVLDLLLNLPSSPTIRARSASIVLSPSGDYPK
jgi:hypothetical protein